MSTPSKSDMWPMERRMAMKAQIDQEAKNAAEALGATGCVIIAFFQDGDLMHSQDGGIAPMPFNELYRRMATAWEVMEASGGEDVAINN